MMTSLLSELSALKAYHKIGLVALLTGVCGVIAFAATGGKPDPARIQFSGVDYFHRWSKDNQHEFTPPGQENLDHWADMLTVNYYPEVKDGESLAQVASNVVENYRDHQALILKTDSVPRTADKPAQHFVAAVFPRPDLIEAVYARFAIVNGVGLSIVYSHREYGQKIGDQMSAWMKQHGPSVEQALMSLDKIPSPEELKK